MTAEEILKALIDEFAIEDYVYEVRECEAKGWDGPRVTRFNYLLEEAEKLFDNG